MVVDAELASVAGSWRSGYVRIDSGATQEGAAEHGLRQDRSVLVPVRVADDVDD